MMIKIKLVLIVSFLFFTSMMSFGQMKISEKGFLKAVDLANYTYVKYSLTNAEEKNRFDESCDCIEDPTFEAIQNAIDTSFEKTIEFSKEFNELKKENINLTQKNIANFLTDSIFSERYSSKYQLIDAYGNKRAKEREYRKLKRDLSGKITNLLNVYTVIEPTVVNNEAISKEIKPEVSSNVIRNKKGWFEGFTFQIDVFSILISIIISVLMVIFIFIKFPDSENATKAHVKRKIGELNLNQTFISNKSEITKLKNDIFELRNLVQKLQIPVEREPQKMEYISPEIQEPEKKSNVIFYLSTPNSDGSFNESSMKSSFIPGATIYKFKKKDTDDKAYFIIDNREEAVKLALQYPNRNIEPCCEATNSYNANATNITTAKPGIAELNNGVWKITRKAEITYEN